MAFGISNNYISYKAVDDIAKVLYCNTKLQKVYFNNNNKIEGLIIIAKALQA